MVNFILFFFSFSRVSTICSSLVSCKSSQIFLMHNFQLFLAKFQCFSFLLKPPIRSVHNLTNITNLSSNILSARPFYFIALSSEASSFALRKKTEIFFRSGIKHLVIHYLFLDILCKLNKKHNMFYIWSWKSWFWVVFAFSKYRSSQIRESW